MAKIDNLFESGQGKLGNLVFYKVGGKGRVRTRAEHFRDRKSPAQLAQRQRLQVVNGFLKPFREAIRITFAGEALGRTAFQAAQSHIMRNALVGEYPDIYVDKSKALLSRGTIPLPVSASVKSHPEGLLVEWGNGEEAVGKAAGDTLVVMGLFEPDSSCLYQFTAISRSDGRYLWMLSRQGQEESLPDVWIAFRNRQETQMSDSMYIWS